MKNESDDSDYHSRDYPLHEDMSFQVKVWTFERLGWYVLVLVVVLAMLGLFSRGPLSAREVKASDGKISVEYELFHRNGSVNPMKINVLGAPGATVELELKGELLEGFSVETMQPEPVRASSGGQGMRLFLQTDTEGRASIYLTLRGDGLGLFKTRITSPGAITVSLDQFIYP
ncbi:Uncharacterised protein [Pseudomonas fluorescens]|uniref:Transmembrane protein n=1 Tax=Pseudomonas fluorescens TaxID=294 RepID=A0A448DYR7_PSEFL|nr:hypothetical protein [Pseudomonas fluorescens]VEF11922.1 Uncharacterised protein [Pseudomonas fluorescens]